MASNNQRAPSVPLPTRWSNEGKKNSKEQQQIVLNQVREMFGTILEPDIILSVVQNCKWQLQPSIEALIMLSENAESPFNNPSENTSYKNADMSIKVGGKSAKNETITRNVIGEGKDVKFVEESLEESVTGFLNLNDKELLRQQNEFRKFELLKKDLIEKGGFVSSVNENSSKSSYASETDKIPASKLQQFGQSWKNDFSKVYYCSEVENASQVGGGSGQINPTVNQLWDNNGSNSEQRKTKETNNQFENLFGSKLQFSRDISPKNSGKGTIPKNNRTQAESSSASGSGSGSGSSSSSSSSSSSQWRQQQQQQQKNVDVDKKGNEKNSNASSSKISNNEYPNRRNSAGDFKQTVNPCLTQDPASQKHQQQVSQFDSNYDNETKTRTAGGKSNIHKGETESLCGLKVQYRLPGLENSSDDDADVVIEEERPDYPTQIPSLLSRNVCHFISSSTNTSCKSPSKKSRPESRVTDSSSPSPQISPQHNTYDNKLKNIISSILKGHKILIIIRGLSGSGKSHLATGIIKSSVGGDERQFVFSADDYFMMGTGVYNYVKSKISEAHAWTQRRVSNALKDGVSPVIVSNTNSQSWELQPYIVMGVQNGYAIEILEPSTPWSRNLKELARKNIHGVPKETIRNMMDRYEHNLTARKLIEQFGLRYSPNNVPPQLRKFPPIGESQEGGQKTERQKPSKRNRRRKKNQTTSSNADSINSLFNDSDKSVKQQAESFSGPKSGNDTLEEIVSNALRSENETLNKSLVDYCIETDSGDELDIDVVPHSSSDNQEVDLFGEDIADDNTGEKFSEKNSSSSSSSFSSAPAVAVIENNEEKHPQILNEEKDDNSCSPKSNEFLREDSSASTAPHNQNLGAIGSERKENVPIIDFKPLSRFDQENESDHDNSLSQCWDFTLLIGDRKIHSGYHFSKAVRRPGPKVNKIESDIGTTDVDYKSGVIITEITEEAEIEIREEESKNRKSLTEDPDIIMDKIMKKMDEMELETNIDEQMDTVKADFGAEFVDAESKTSSDTPGPNNSTKDSPQIRKDSLKFREGTMKYKYQTNDNSLSENDAFENEMSHREPILFTTGEENGEEGSPDFSEIQMTSKTIDDSLTKKLSALKPNENNPTSDCERNLCEVSEPVTFDTSVLRDELECVIDDTLSKKLSEESIQEIGAKRLSENNAESEAESRTMSLCVNSSLESLVTAVNDLKETKRGDNETAESNVEGKSPSEFVSDEVKEDGDKYVAKNAIEGNVESENTIKDSSELDHIDIKNEVVDSTEKNPSLTKIKDSQHDDLTETTGGSNSTEERNDESKDIAKKCGNSTKDEEKCEMSQMGISNPLPELEIGKEVPEKNEDDLLNVEKKESANEKSNVDKTGLRYMLETISDEDGERLVLVTVKKDLNEDQIEFFETDSDGDSSMAVCCEECDENGVIYSETENTGDSKHGDEDDGFVEYKTSDDSGVDNSGEGDKERQRREEEAEKNAVEIVDNINRVTWKESPFPLPPPDHSISNNGTDNFTEKFIPIAKSESSTNTSNYDFNVLYVGGTSEYKIMSTKNRNINSGLSSNRCCEEKPPLKLMLDKSSMTSVVDILSGEESGLESKTEVEALKDVDELTEMFPNLSREDITDIYRNLCSGDFDWAVEVLLDGVPDHVTKYTKIDRPRIVIEKQSSLPGVSEFSDSQSLQSSTQHKDKLDKLKQRSSSLESNDNTDPKLNYSPRKKKDRHKVSEETLELKRQIEEKMVISEASYNPHILKVKRWKNGEPDVPNDDTGNDSQPQNKSVIEFPQSLFTKGEEESCEISEGKQSSPKSSESADDLTEDDTEPEEMIELNLGQDFIKVLETEFGNPDFNIPDGLFPVIQIKKSMAQQLHALWVESMEQQMNAQQEQLDKMLEKDAEYARSLEQEEARNITEPNVPNLSEIMDMEMAFEIYKNDMKKQLKLETPNDMASRLSRRMLHDMFTDQNPETLDEILNAHHGNFEETVEILEASTGQIADRNSTLKKQKNLIDRAKEESIRSEEEEYDRSSIDSPIGINSELNQAGCSLSTLTYDDAIKEAKTARQEAQYHLSMRNENFNKAKEAFRNRNLAVAGHYSEIAKLHKAKMEYANSTAASAFLAAQDYKINARTTLDLHYLYVAEALQALELFLDHHIAKLNQNNKKSINLYIITGRGARSNGGYSKLKPAVSKKLASKNLRYTEENPGCLKVVIHRRNNKTVG